MFPLTPIPSPTAGRGRKGNGVNGNAVGRRGGSGDPPRTVLAVGSEHPPYVTNPRNSELGTWNLELGTRNYVVTGWGDSVVGPDAFMDCSKIGRTMRKQVPWPTSLVKVTRPPWRMTMP
jgi:hypothetical protein